MLKGAQEEEGERGGRLALSVGGDVSLKHQLMGFSHKGRDDAVCGAEEQPGLCLDWALRQHKRELK